MTALALAALLSSCATKEGFVKKFGKRKDLTPVRSSFGINTAPGTPGDLGDEDEIRSKFAESGWEKDKNGNITGAKRRNLFSDKNFNRGSDFDKKEAKIANKEVTREVFRTPEYLERQKFDTDSANEGTLAAREADFDNQRAGEFREEARESGSEATGFFEKLNPFRKKPSAREAGQAFKTPSGSRFARARENVAVPTAVSMPRDGDLNRAAMSMDDVKKLLHPEAFD